MKKSLLSLCAGLVVLSPAAFAAEKSCLFSNRVDGYTEAKRDSIVLTAGLDRWKAEFANRCTGVEFAMQVGVDSRTTCVTPGDSIKFKQTGGLPQTCTISALTYLPKPEKDEPATTN